MSLATANASFAIAGINLELCGEPVFVDSDYYYNNIIQDKDAMLEIFRELSYTSSDANIYTDNDSGNLFSGDRPPNPFGLFPCLDAIPNPAVCEPGTIDNVIYLPSRPTYFGTTISHEFGHHLGLIHIFDPTKLFHLPVLPNQPDHPKEGDFPRELIIRTTDEGVGKDFPTPNCPFAGDLCCDTPVAGRHALSAAPSVTGPASIWPAAGFQFDPNNFDEPIPPGILFDNSTCTYYGEYQDYNEMPFDEQDGLEELGRNLMGYTSCAELITPDQIDRLFRFYNERRQGQYELDLCGNHEDKVLFWNLPEKSMNEISIQTRHSENYKYANTFTNTNGEFSSILYDNQLTSNIRKLGTNGLDNYTAEDWSSEVNLMDIIRGARHIVGLEPFTSGFQYLAADTDNNHEFSVFDLIDMQKLILGVFENFPNQPSPWRFSPEFVPSEYTSQFNNNPFEITINGTSLDGPEYLNSDWEYSITNGTNGNAGYAGYKVGDIDASSSEFAPQEGGYQYSILNESNPTLTPGQTHYIGINVKNNIELQGIQLSLKANKGAHVEVNSSILDEFSIENNSNIINSREGEKLELVWVNALGKSTNENFPILTLGITVQTATSLNELFIKENKGNYLISDFSQPFSENSIEFALLENQTEFRKTRKINQLTKIFPNPAGEKLFISTNELSKNGTVEFFSVDGNLVFAKRLKKDQTLHEFSTKNIENGMYYIRINTESESQLHKIIINKK